VTAPPAPRGALHEARLHRESWGEAGPRLLLLHSIGLDLHSWDAMAPLLAGRCRLVAVDLPGHGESDRPPEVDYSLPALGERVILLLDELGWEEAILVGNSLGGGTALAAAVAAPSRVTGLVLVNSVSFRWALPPLGLLATLPGVSELAGALPMAALHLGLRLARYVWGSATPEQCARVRRYFRDPEGRSAFFRMLTQLYGPGLDQVAGRYGEIRCPAAVLHGRSDPVLPLRSSAALAQAIPDAELRPVRWCGHFPHEERPRKVAGEIRRFLKRLAAREAGDAESLPGPGRS